MLDELESTVYEHEIIEKLTQILESTPLPGNKKNLNVERNIEIFYERTFRDCTFEEIALAHNISKSRANQIYRKLLRICFYNLCVESK